MAWIQISGGQSKVKRKYILNQGALQPDITFQTVRVSNGSITPEKISTWWNVSGGYSGVSEIRLDGIKNLYNYKKLTVVGWGGDVMMPQNGTRFTVTYTIGNKTYTAFESQSSLTSKVYEIDFSDAIGINESITVTVSYWGSYTGGCNLTVTDMWLE